MNPQPPRNKTGRRYGRIYQLILDYAAEHRRFCTTELRRWLAPKQIRNACRQLAATGRLKLLVKSDLGRNRRRSFYARA
jgi:hypothetical protein